MPRVCVFDVIETVLNLGALDGHFQRVFGDAAVRQQWFNQLLQSAMVATLTDTYAPFGTIAGTALDMVAARHGTNLGQNDRRLILDAIKTLPPHPDAVGGLARLQNAGFRLAALTNSTGEVAQAQLRSAGLATYFEQVLSVDDVRRFKPAPEPYRMAAERLGVPVANVRLIAAHAWDVAGALQAGCAAAFVARQGNILDPFFLAPDIAGNDLIEVAERIIAVETD